ncbi:hemolysin-III related [mine drainage metagenome]|uniref:Hemolysin-III related n=1 Tax=mine drainage metagenome TaxID=410659 RepID=A0A1J5PFY5_9ZZZZ
MYHGERFNAISHLIGAVLALAGGVLLIVLAAQHGNARTIIGVSIYSVALVLLYTVSTLYHSLRGRAKDILRKLDYQAIYLLIAGSYTPFCLVTLHGVWGWSLLGIVWTLAIIGMWQELHPKNEARVLSVVIYVLMGWVVLIAIVPLLHALGRTGFIWLAAGGIFYTGGIIFYAYDYKFKHWHGIWHLFVVAGSATHYFAILFYVV